MFRNGAPATLGSYTTEVTAILDWGLVAPLFLWTAINLLRHRPNGFVLAPILTFFMILVGIVVLGQRLMQAFRAETVTFAETGVYVLPFVLLSAMGTVVLVNYLQTLRPNRLLLDKEEPNDKSRLSS
ncbi:MAG: hypothetical protein DDG59_11795 [Anaerolineae bacterium]|nr:MAG: hypothetical protein DDG59_11795 [Anaerolineae bacterium]